MSQKVEIAIVTWLLVSLTQVPVISFRRPIRHSLLATANPGLVTAGHRQLETPRGSPALGVPGESWGSPYWLVRSVWPHMPRMAPQLAVTWLYLFLFFNPMAAHWFQWTQAARLLLSTPPFGWGCINPQPGSSLVSQERTYLTSTAGTSCLHYCMSLGPDSCNLLSAVQLIKPLFHRENADIFSSLF